MATSHRTHLKTSPILYQKPETLPSPLRAQTMKNQNSTYIVSLHVSFIHIGLTKNKKDLSKIKGKTCVNSGGREKLMYSKKKKC